MAHDAILQTLQQIGYFIGPHEPLGTRRQGNLGEFIAFHAALSDKLPYSLSMGASGMDPLQNVAAPGLDITYLYFDINNPANDLMYIQEVKTTGQVNLAYADNLVSDHDKLFGGDPALTLNSRIQSMGLRLKLQHQRPDLATRLQSMASTAPLSCTHVRLIPTLVHEKIGTDPKTKMLAVRSQINALGWPLGQIRPWSIGMENLIDRLTRLAQGQP